MDQKPTVIWIILAIVIGVGLYQLIYQGLYSIVSIDLDGFEMFIGVGPIILGIITLLVAFMVFNKSGRVFLTVILVLAIIINLLTIVSLKFLEDLLGVSLGGYIGPVIELVLALVVFILLYQPAARQYFKS
jgi:hypothetical protein